MFAILLVFLPLVLNILVGRTRFVSTTASWLNTFLFVSQAFRSIQKLVGYSFPEFSRFNFLLLYISYISSNEHETIGLSPSLFATYKWIFCDIWCITRFVLDFPCHAWICVLFWPREIIWKHMWLWDCTGCVYLYLLLRIFLDFSFSGSWSVTQGTR